MHTNYAHTKRYRAFSERVGPRTLWEISLWANNYERPIHSRGGYIVETIVIQNKVFVGQRFSYYSTRTFLMRFARKRTKYYYFCKPSVKSWTRVSLKCPGKKHNQVDKLVEVIYACSCRNCSKGPESSENSLRWDLERFWLIWWVWVRNFIVWSFCSTSLPRSFQMQEIAEKMRASGILWKDFFSWGWGEGWGGENWEVGRLDRMRFISRTYFTIRSCNIRLSWTNNSL